MRRSYEFTASSDSALEWLQAERLERGAALTPGRAAGVWSTRLLPGCQMHHRHAGEQIAPAAATVRWVSGMSAVDPLRTFAPPFLPEPDSRFPEACCLAATYCART